jgi:hypothetical protein
MRLPSSMICRLLAGEHLFPQEREQFGITSTTQICLDDLERFLANEINHANRFPPETKQDSLSPLYEGIKVTKVSEDKFVCTTRRALANNPSEIAEQAETVFNNAKDAAKFFLKWELYLPGRLDGIIVE